MQIELRKHWQEPLRHPLRPANPCRWLPGNSYFNWLYRLLMGLSDTANGNFQLSAFMTDARMRARAEILGHVESVVTTLLIEGTSPGQSGNVEKTKNRRGIRFRNQVQ